MLKRFSQRFEVPAAGTIHLPWQGSWQVRARQLRAAIEVMGAHIPVIAWEQDGHWTLARFTCGPDDAPWTLHLEHNGKQLITTLEGEWENEPQWTVEPCGNYAALLARIGSYLPSGSAKPQEPIRRAFILDIHTVPGKLVQTFDDVAAFVRQCADLGIAEGTMFYLPGWSGLYDGNYPDYEPAEDAGGAAGLERLATLAREHGGWVVPHLNHWALTAALLEKYPHFEPHIMRKPNGERAGWPGIELMNISHRLYYVDPSSEPWLDHFSARLTALEKLGLNAAYLDQVAPPLGENFRRQTRSFTREIHRRHPGLLFGSESPHSEVVDCTGYAQLWGPIWSIMPKVPVLKPSSLLADALAPWLTLVGHIGIPAPYPVPYVWTHFPYLAEHGSAKFCREVWEVHQGCGVAPTMRLLTTKQRVNEKILTRLFC